MTVKERIKEHEGFRDTVYLDSLGKRTVGYGHLCVEDHWEDGKKYDKEYLDEIFDKDFQNAADQCEDLCNDYELELPETVTDVLIEMIFQLGIGNVMKFKKCLAALQEKDFETASLEMLDSRWASQTPSRAEKLSLIVKEAAGN